MIRSSRSSFRPAARRLLTAAIVGALPLAASAAPAVPYFSEPAVSPDRSELAFVSGGDIWTTPITGGEARLLVAHPATESRPLYSPDGRYLAFSSNRSGNGDVYVLTLETGDLRRLTFDDGLDQLDAWSPDGRYLYFSSTSRDIAGMNDIYRVPATGGTPTAVSADRYANEFFAAPSPDGRTLAFSARGVASNQWWRHGHSHLDEAEIWLRREGSGPTAYEALTKRGAKDLWPMWGSGGQRLFYVSDRNGAENLWVLGVGGGAAEPRQVTSFKDGRVLWPSISADGKLIAFERNFKLWTMDTDNGQVKEVAVRRRGAPAGTAIERVRFTDRLQELAVSPDGKKVAFVVHGEVFAASATDGGDATRLSLTPAAESDITWAPDSRRLLYLSERDGATHVYSYDFGSGKETRLTNDRLNDAAPRLSPDGKELAFERDARELRVLDLASKQERVVATGIFDRPPLHAERSIAWSPDGRWLAFMPSGNRFFTNVMVAPANGGAARPISFVANSNSNAVSWSPDGKYVLFDTGQRTEDAQVARIDLLPRTPRFREDQFRDLFREQPAPSPTAPDKNTAPPVKPATSTPRPNALPAAAADTTRTKAPKAKRGKNSSVAASSGKPPVHIVFEDIRRRLSLLPIGVNVGSHAISPDGKWLLLVGFAANQTNLYVYPLDELSKEAPVVRQLTSTTGLKREAQFSPDSKEVYYLDQGRIQVVPVEAGKGTPRTLAVSAEMDVDFEQEKQAVFEQAWSYLRDHFADPKFNGVDWQAKHDEFAPLVAGARTVDESRRLINLMIGELNASHTGLGPAPAAGTSVAPSTGRLGLRFDAAEYEQHGRLRITSVLPLSAAALAGLQPGSYLLAVDGTPITPTTNLDELLQYKVGRRVLLRVASAPAGADTKKGRSAAPSAARDVVVRPISRETEKALDYRQWVEERRAYVARVSGGRLGYVHMYDMSAGSLAQLYLDLDTENMGRDGVVVDVRNNNGGFVNVYAIDVLARRSYLSMTGRNQAQSGPARGALGQRALELPTVLVTNQHSLSDAEDFSEGYRALNLGKIVGEPTGGWIIFTSNVSLLDGSSLRLPSTTITATRDGKIMEMNPRPVDVPSVRPIGESYGDRDVQLDTAVKELLAQLGAKSGTKAAGGN
ncbi:LpqB family beta-propeller domain-containing protein [Hymenobacter sp. BT175]|uniref:S41 family peptidase n=1 Tax=Hymenobacter translucens TaxID=2886507 RepID=UPI001D0EEAB9|nr:LpqB family beta-propeller domain-containing protein [Hymenobacter translucens]MCC2547279.1 LpqB family beta-propeller domain-containing protein [Hymenobacter translucens]